jgi:hypothetical protein
MALYNLQIISCNCGDIRCLPQTITVDADINDLIVGNVYSFSSITDCGNSEVPIGPIGPIGPIQECFPFGCYIIQQINIPRIGAQENAIIVNSYGSSQRGGCNDCTDDISNYLVFQNCFQLFGQELYVPIDQITPTPVVGDYYFLEYVLVNQKEGGIYQAFGCFQFKGKEYISPDGGANIRFGEVLILTSTTQTDCQTCLQNSAILYEGFDCLTQNLFIVALPSEGLENHLITYTGLDGLTQYCGIIQRQAQQGEIIDVLLVSILGVLNDVNTCDDCLAQANEKKELINCIDPNITEVVWASVLFEPENSTHLSFGNGCYEVGDTVDPSTPITITELANFDPQENCEDCLECHGVIYDYTSCEELEVCGPTNIIDFNNDGYSQSRDFVIDSGNFMFVPFRDSNRIVKYDLTTETVVSQSNQVLQGAESLAIDEINGVICVSNNFSNYVTFFDYNDLSQSVNIFTPQSGPKKVYYEPIDSYFYVTLDSCCVVPGIVVYSGTSYNSMSQIATFGNTQQYRDIVRVGSNIYTLNSNNNTLEIWSITGPTSYSQTSSINLGTQGDSLTYDSSSNVIYIKTFTNYYIRFFVGSATLLNIIYSTPCGYGEGKISVNNPTNKIYITDTSCNTIYEFDKTTDTLLNTYNNLGNNNISSVYGIGIDTSSNTWFGAYNNTFQLGCTTEFANGQVTSNELLPTGTTFFNYSLSACCEITSVQSITEDNFLTPTEYISMLHFEDCGTCLGSDVQIFVCRDCGDLGEALIISSGGTHNVGDFVRSQYGNSDFVCLEIVDVYTSDYGNGYRSFVSDGINYTSCEECSSGATLGLTIINCDTLEPSQVNVSLSEWSEISGFPFSIPNSVISDSNGVCYQVVNACPINNVYPPFEISNFYYNQSFCRASSQRSPEPPRSAGTEYFECVICCDCGSTGSTVTQVSPPHPVWTDGYGTPVTQLNMVALGGMFGLNN